MPPARNIEVKARVADLKHAHAIAEKVATARLGVQRQKDTYFRCACGRLKLREIDGQSAQLIGYTRADRPAARPSDYQLAEFADHRVTSQLRELLNTALGILAVIEKTREVFLYHNVRIHLDEVAGLGSFLEFEAVLDSETDEAIAHDRLIWLQEQFQVTSADLMSGSYSDMLLKSGSDR